ncbi:MAG TPA: glycosyltransferase [Candidatus Udaeobacter sp.]|jgi:GT2 family glycosyltransferase
MKSQLPDATASFLSPATPAEQSSGANASLSCSVIIPVWCGGTNFAKCLSSAMAAIQNDDEIIVVADGESDGSWRIAEQMSVPVVKLRATSGPGRARNVGAETSKCDILFFIDADVTIPPDSIERIRSIFETEKDLAALIGSYDEQPSEANFHSQYKNLFHYYVHQHGRTEASTFWGACGAIRREVFLKAGGFDPSYNRPCIEDIELGYRLKAASEKIRLVPDLQVKHLKRWNAYSLIETDVFDRATPWTELIWDRFIRRRPLVRHDLNLGVSYRLSLITSFLFVAALVGALFTRWAVPFVLLFGFLFVLLQVPFFSFFRMKRGLSFAFRALAWRFGYDLYSGLGFFYGSLRFANSSTKKILGQAFAKLDAVALGVAVGTVWGGAIWLMTVLLLAKGGERIGPNLSLLSQFIPGYSVTWIGSLVGLLYGFGTGFVFGFAFARARNTAMRLHLGSRKLRRHFAALRHE